MKLNRTTLEILPIGLGYGLGSISLATLPIWMGAIMTRYHLNAGTAGAIVTLELGGLAAASIFAVAVNWRSRPTHLLPALAGSMVVNVLSAFSPSAAALAFLRLAAGVCHGLIVVIVTRLAAQKTNAPTYFSAQLFSLVVYAVAFFVIAQVMTNRFGLGAPFLSYAIFGLVALICTVAFMPHDVGAPVTAGQVSAVRWGAIATTLTGIALTFCLQSALWAFLAPAAQTVGVPMDRLNRILALGALANLSAPLLASAMLSKWTLASCLILGYVGLALSLLGVGASMGAWPFMTGAIGINFFMIMLSVFMLATLSIQESSGRASAIGPAFFMTGSAVGPLLGGAMLLHSGLQTLTWFAVAAAAIALALVLSAVKSTRLVDPIISQSR